MNSGGSYDVSPPSRVRSVRSPPLVQEGLLVRKLVEMIGAGMLRTGHSLAIWFPALLGRASFRPHHNVRVMAFDKVEDAPPW